MGGSGVDSRNAFVSGAAGRAAERLVACSIDTFSRRAADLPCGADGRHRQVAHGGKRGGSATQIRSERGVLHQRTLRGALSAIDYRGRRGPAGGGHFTQPAPRRGDYRQCCRPLSGRGRATHTGVARIDSVTAIFSRSAAGASATCVDRRPSGRSRSFFYGADTEPATLAWPLDSLPAKTRAASSCDTLRLTPSPPFSRRPVARYFPARHLYLAHGSSAAFFRAR